MKHLVKGLLILFSAFLAVACGPSTKLLGSWTNKDELNNKYEKLAVAVLVPNNSPRYLMERAFVKDLKENDINATATYDIFPLAGKQDQLAELDEDLEARRERVKAKVQEHGIDALVIVTLLDTKKEQRYVNSQTYNMAGTGYYGGYGPGVGLGYGSPFMYGAYYNYYSYSAANMYQPGYYTEDVTYFLECNLYDVEKEILLWSGRTETKNLKDMEEEAAKISDILVKDIMFSNIIVP
jgi:hypothetical protein